MILYLRTTEEEGKNIFRNECFANGAHSVMMRAVKMSLNPPPMDDPKNNTLVRGEFELTEEEIAELRSPKNASVFFIPAILLTKTTVKCEMDVQKQEDID
jgi:hypothetical protein